MKNIISRLYGFRSAVIQKSAYDLYDQDKEGYFSFMDAVVAEAEKQNIGIIASLMWWDPALSMHVGEKRPIWARQTARL